MSAHPRLVVVVPPHASSMANGPPLAPLLLRYYLDGCGIEVELFDANVRFFRWLLRPELRAELRDELHGRLARELASECLSSEDLTRVGRLITFSLSDYCRGGELSFLRSGFDWGAAHELVLGEDDGFRRRVWSRAMDALALEIIDAEPDHLAFSVLFHEQCQAMVELCRRLRDHGFDGRIVMGGAAIKLSDDPYLARLLRECSADIAYRFNLYHAMEPLAELLTGKRAAGEVADASFLDEAGGLRHVGGAHQRARTLAGPLSYDIVDPAPYFPAQIYPVLVSEGCYWGKCDFCDYPYLASQDPFIVSALFRDPAVVVADVQTVVDRFEVREIDLISDAVPLGYFPRLLRAGGGSLRERGVRLECSIRAEPRAAARHFEAMAACGVDRVTIGVEALSDEVLAGMQKGNTYADVMRSVGLARAAGIKVKANLIYDHPRIETRHIPEMMERLAELSPHLDSLAVHSFGLTPHSPLAHRPESAGLVVLSGLRRSTTDHGHHHLEFRRKHEDPERPGALARFREAVEIASYEIDARRGRIPEAERVIALPYRWRDERALHDPEASDLLIAVPGKQAPFSFFVGEYERG